MESFSQLVYPSMEYGDTVQVYYSQLVYPSMKHGDTVQVHFIRNRLQLRNAVYFDPFPFFPIHVAATVDYMFAPFAPPTITG